MTCTEKQLWTMYWAERVMGIISLVPYDNPMRFKHSYFSHCGGEKTGWRHMSDLIKVSTLHLIVHTTGALPTPHHPLSTCTSGLPWCFALEIGAWSPPEENTGDMWGCVLAPRLFLGLWEACFRKVLRGTWCGRYNCSWSFKTPPKWAWPTLHLWRFNPIPRCL